MAIDLSTLLGQTAAVNDAGAQATQEILGTYGQIKSANEDRITAVQKKAASDTIVMQQIELGQLTAQQNTREAATALGTNMDDLGQIVTTLGADMKNSYAKARAALQRVNELRSADFIGNPLGYFSAQFALPSAINAYNSAAEEFNLAYATNQGLQSATQSIATTQAAIAETKSAATIQAKADAIAAAAADASSAIKIENLKYNILGIQAVQEMTGAALERNFRAYNAIESAEGRALQRKQLELSEKSLQLSIDERTERLQQNKLAREEEAELAATVNMGRAAVNLPPLPQTKVLQLMKMGGDFGAQMRDFYSIGARTSSIGEPVIAPSPAEAGKTILQTKAPLVGSVKPVKELVTSAYGLAKSGQLAQQNADFRLLDTKNEPAVLDAANKVIQSQVSSMAKQIKPGDATNIYAGAPLPELINLRAMQEQPFVVKVLAPQVEAGMIENDPSKVMAIALAAAQKNEITYKEAVAGVTALYKAAVAQNNETKQYSRFGIPRQTSYPARIVPPGFEQYGVPYKETFDLTNETDVGTFMNKALSTRLVNTFRLFAQ